MPLETSRAAVTRTDAPFFVPTIRGMRKRMWTYPVASASIFRYADDGPLFVLAQGILTAGVVTAMRRDVGLSGENLDFGVVVDLRNTIHAVRASCLIRKHPTPQVDRVAVAMLVKPEDLPLWREYARGAAQDGLLRRAFTDAGLAAVWAEARARAQLSERRIDHPRRVHL